MSNTSRAPRAPSDKARALEAEVLRLAALAEYQHQGPVENPACRPGAPNVTRIAEAVGKHRQHVQQILRRERERTAQAAPQDLMRDAIAQVFGA